VKGKQVTHTTTGVLPIQEENKEEDIMYESYQDQDMYLEQKPMAGKKQKKKKKD